MARITVLGGTGYAGAHIVREAIQRGHEVVSVSRTAPDALPDGVVHRVGDVRDEALLREIAADADAVIAAASPRGDLAVPGVLRTAYATLARHAAENDTRLGVIGGAGSLRMAEGGPKLVDAPDFPDAFVDEARELEAVLDDLQARADGLDWFYISPAAGFNALNPGEATGTYRTGGDLLLADESGKSELSGADLALAVLDEVEKPAHSRERFAVAY